MTDELARDEAFWKLVAALDEAGVLEHVMVIGTWAEWLYSDYFAAIAGAGDYRVERDSSTRRIAARRLSLRASLPLPT